jgi:hypothetical protein
MKYIVKIELKEREGCGCAQVRGTTAVFPGCVVGIATDLAAGRTAVRFPVSAGVFLLSEPVQTGSGFRQSFAPIGTGVLYQLWCDRSVTWATHLI